MEYIAAYALLVLGGNQQPSSQDIKALFAEVGVHGQDEKINLVVVALQEQSLENLKSEGLGLIKSFPQNQQLIDEKISLLNNKYLEVKKREDDQLKQKQLLEEQLKKQSTICQKELEEKKESIKKQSHNEAKEAIQKEENISRLRNIKSVQDQVKLLEKKIQENKKQTEKIHYYQQQDLKTLNVQKKLSEQLKQKNSVEKIYILEKEVQTIENNDQITKTFKNYQIAKCEQQKLQVLKESNLARKPTPIYHMQQQITASNQEVLFYVISENFRRDQNRELLITPKSQKVGLTSALFPATEDQQCLSFRTTKVEFEEINNDEEKKAQFILDFKLKVSANLNIPFEDIEILDIVKGSSIVKFTTKQKRELNQVELEVLETHCGGKIEVYNYFACGYTGENSLVGLSSEDFQPQYNMQWGANFQEKEQRGPKTHRYDYYFPRGYYGYALNVLNKYGIDNSWILMDGNDKEWRILYHGTNQDAMSKIVEKGLTHGHDKLRNRQRYTDDKCLFTNQIVGNGVYFSNLISEAENYASPTWIGNKQFKLIFQSRVNPPAIRQSKEMKELKYFVVNQTIDIRPYRILLKEV